MSEFNEIYIATGVALKNKISINKEKKENFIIINCF